MNELENIEIEEQVEDNGKIHFPKSGLFIIGGLVLLMIACVVAIIILRNQ